MVNETYAVDGQGEVITLSGKQRDISVALDRYFAAGYILIPGSASGYDDGHPNTKTWVQVRKRKEAAC